MQPWAGLSSHKALRIVSETVNHEWIKLDSDERGTQPEEREEPEFIG